MYNVIFIHFFTDIYVGKYSLIIKYLNETSIQAILKYKIELFVKCSE